MTEDTATPTTPATRLPLILTALAITSANFMNALDMTIALVALPSISGTLGASPSQGAWVLTTYTVCLAVVLPLSPWMCKRFGEVHVFTGSVLMFTLTSWACGVSSSMESLVFFRAIQGLSSGLIIPLSQTMLLRIFPPERHGTAIALWSLVSVIAPVLGPILGGIITDSLSWPWIFYINVPIGITAAWIVWTSMHKIETKIQKIPVDAVGMLLLAVTVLLFQLVLDRGQELDWLGSPDIRLMINIAVITLIAYVVWERKEPHPLLDYSLFKNPVFVASAVMGVIFNLTYFSCSVIYPIWMQTALGYTATLSGLVMAGTSVLPIIGMMLVGKYIAYLNLRYLIILGALITMYGIYLQAISTTDSTFTQLLLARVAVGIGFTFLFPPLMAITLGSVSQERTVSAASFFNFFRNVASSVGIAVAISIWQAITVYHRQNLVEELNPAYAQKEVVFQAVEQLSGNGDALWVVTDKMATIQASTLGMNDTFLVFIVVAMPLLVLAMFIPAKLGPKPTDESQQDMPKNNQPATDTAEIKGAMATE